ncbi:MAG: RluA family pseudouridine synthase [Phycisphaerales bacterium]
MARKRSNGPTRPQDDPLIGPGGKVSKAALYRASQADIAKRKQGGDAPTRGPTPPSAIGTPSRAINDESPITRPPPPQDEEADEPPPQRVVFTLSHDLDKRLDKYLVDRVTFMSRAKLQALIEEGGVLVNGRPGKNATKLRINDTVEVFIPPPPSEHVPPQDIPLSVMFEDEHIIVINKSPDIIVHPARSHLSGTMINALAYHFRHRSSGGLSEVGKQFARPGVIHRLDRQTSGVIVFAKTEQAHWQVARQFEQRTTEKRYLAFVHGRPEPPIDIIELPMGPHPSRERGLREKQAIRHDHLGKAAVTVYRTLGNYNVPRKGSKWPVTPDLTGPRQNATDHQVSLLEIELRTGRTHQIRLHLSHLGWPLIADDLYGGKIVPQCGRVALHAALLKFCHPITNTPLSFQAPLPDDLASLLAFLRKGKGAEEFTDVSGAVVAPP